MLSASKQAELTTGHMTPRKGAVRRWGGERDTQLMLTLNTWMTHKHTFSQRGRVDGPWKSKSLYDFNICNIYLLLLLYIVIAYLDVESKPSSKWDGNQAAENTGRRDSLCCLQLFTGRRLLARKSAFNIHQCIRTRGDRGGR